MQIYTTTFTYKIKLFFTSQDTHCFCFTAMCNKVVDWNFHLLALLQTHQSLGNKFKVKSIGMIKVVLIPCCFFMLFLTQDLLQTGKMNIDRQTLFCIPLSCMKLLQFIKSNFYLYSPCAIIDLVHDKPDINLINLVI